MQEKIIIKFFSDNGGLSTDMQDNNYRNIVDGIYDVQDDVKALQDKESQDKQDIEQIKEVNANQQIAINNLQTKQTEIEQQVETNTDDIENLKNSSVSLKNVLNPLVKLPLKSSLKGEYQGNLIFKRAGEASYINRQGVRVIAAVDEPRFEKEGFLHEDSSTNNLYPDSGSGAFTRSGMTATSGIDDASLTTNAMRYISNNNASNPKINVNQPYPFVENEYVSFSVDVRPQSLRWVRLNAKNGGQDFSVFFDLEEIKDGYKSDNITACKIKKLISGYFRISISFKSIATENNIIEICLADNDNDYNFVGDGVSGVDVDCIQGEPLPFSTSHIKTIDSPVTRPQDEGIKIPFSKNHSYLNDEFSVAFRFYSHGLDPNFDRGLFSLDNSNVQFNLLRRNRNKNNLHYYRMPGGFQSNSELSFYNNRVALTVKNNLTKLYIDSNFDSQASGGLKQENGIPTYLVVCFGAFSSAWCGHVSDFEIFDIELSENEIKFMHGE